MDKNIDYEFNEIAARTIKKYREEKNMSLEDVVKKMKNSITRQSLYKYENNLARMKLKIFADICKVLNIDVEEILNQIGDELYKKRHNCDKEKQPNNQDLINNIKYIIECDYRDKKTIAHDLKISEKKLNNWLCGNELPNNKEIELIAKYFGIKKSSLTEKHNLIVGQRAADRFLKEKMSKSEYIMNRNLNAIAAFIPKDIQLFSDKNIYDDEHKKRYCALFDILYENNILNQNSIMNLSELQNAKKYMINNKDEINNEILKRKDNYYFDKSTFL